MGRNGSGKSSLLWALQGSGPRRRRQRRRRRRRPGRRCRPRGPAAGRAWSRRPRPTCLPRHGRRRVRPGRPRVAAPRPGPCRALLDRLVPGIAADAHPGDLSEGQRLALVLADPARRRAARCCCSTSRPGASTTRPRRASRRSSPSSPADGHAVVVATHDVEFVADRRRPGRRHGRGRDRRRRPDRRGRRRVAGVRPAGRQDPGAAAVAHRRPGRRRPGRADVRSVSRASTCRWRARPRPAASASPRCWPRSRRRWRRSSGRCSSRPGRRLGAQRRRRRSSSCADPAGAGRGRARRGRPTAASTPRRSPCSACCPRSTPRCGRSAPARPASRPVFFLLVLAGRVFGPGFGFVLGCTSLFASALLTAGVGPWLPFQMLGRGLGRARRRPAAAARRGRAEIAMLAAYGVVRRVRVRLPDEPVVLAVRASAATPTLSYVAGAPLLENLHRFLVFTVLTSTLGWDTGRAITNVIAIVLLGRPCCWRCAGPPAGPPSTPRSLSSPRPRSAVCPAPHLVAGHGDHRVADCGVSRRVPDTDLLQGHCAPGVRRVAGVPRHGDHHDTRPPVRGPSAERAPAWWLPVRAAPPHSACR